MTPKIETPICTRRTTSHQFIYLTTTTYVRRSGRITNGMLSGRTTLQDSAFSSPTPVPPPERPSQKEPGSGLTASAPVLDVSAPACTNGVLASSAACECGAEK